MHQGQALVWPRVRQYVDKSEALVFTRSRALVWPRVGLSRGLDSGLSDEPESGLSVDQIQSPAFVWTKVRVLVWTRVRPK